MKKMTKQIVILSLLAFAITSCKETSDSKTKEAEELIEDTKTIVEETLPSITIEKLEGSPAYADAILQLETPKTGVIANGEEANFKFTVENYELGAQTNSVNAEVLANSGKGQHIHFILNNEPYSAHYDSAFAKAIPDGTHHLVAFLSRSYHESVKNENSVVVRKLEVGENPKDSLGIDVETPTLIYSRPKGEYSGKDAENLMLDFFVLNTTLSPEGNKVRATINGNEFLITEWAPHVMKGLPKGEVSIKLELIDAQGAPIPGPFNTVHRTVTLKEE